MYPPEKCFMTEVYGTKCHGDSFFMQIRAGFWPVAREVLLWNHSRAWARLSSSITHRCLMVQRFQLPACFVIFLSGIDVKDSPGDMWWEGRSTQRSRRPPGQPRCLKRTDPRWSSRSLSGWWSCWRRPPCLGELEPPGEWWRYFQWVKPCLLQKCSSGRHIHQLKRCKKSFRVGFMLQNKNRSTNKYIWAQWQITVFISFFSTVNKELTLYRRARISFVGSVHKSVLKGPHLRSKTARQMRSLARTVFRL